MKRTQTTRSRLTARPFDPADALHWQHIAFFLVLLIPFALLYWVYGDNVTIGIYYPGNPQYWWIDMSNYVRFLFLMMTGFCFTWMAMLTGQRTARQTAKPVWGAQRRKGVARACGRHDRHRGTGGPPFPKGRLAAQQSRPWR